MDKVINSLEAQSKLPQLTLDQIIEMYPEINTEEDSYTHRLIYLGHVCSRGDYNALVTFLEGLDGDDKYVLLNATPYMFYYGNILHITLYWNTGDRAVYMFKLLVESGSEYVRDYYKKAPWEQVGDIWTSIVNHNTLGERDPKEFEETYTFLRKHYSLDDIVITDDE
jgi:hypothetical protein